MLKTENAITDFTILWKEPIYKTSRKTIDLSIAKRILDNHNNPTNYYISDSIIFRHNPKHIESWEDIIALNLKPEFTEVLNNDFIKDDKRVFLRAKLQRGVNPKNFQILNHLFAGNKEIIITRYGNAKIEDPETFKVIDNGLMPSPFSSELDGYKCGYAIDKYFAYYFDESTSTQHAIKIKACKKPNSLKSLGFSYSKDDENVYLEGKKIVKAKPETFEILNRNYSTDGKNIFYHQRTVENIDLKSFVILPTKSYPKSPNKILNSSWGKDKNNYFKMGFTNKKSKYEEHLKLYEIE